MILAWGIPDSSGRSDKELREASVFDFVAMPRQASSLIGTYFILLNSELAQAFVKTVPLFTLESTWRGSVLSAMTNVTEVQMVFWDNVDFSATDQEPSPWIILNWIGGKNVAESDLVRICSNIEPFNQVCLGRENESNRVKFIENKDSIVTWIVTKDQVTGLWQLQDLETRRHLCVRLAGDETKRNVRPRPFLKAHFDHNHCSFVVTQGNFHVFE